MRPFLRGSTETKTCTLKTAEELFKSLGEGHEEVKAMAVADRINTHRANATNLAVAEASSVGWDPLDFKESWSSIKDLLSKCKNSHDLLHQTISSLKEVRRLANNASSSASRQAAHAVRRITEKMHIRGFPSEAYTWLLQEVFT